jgi:hypothetical protein
VLQRDFGVEEGLWWPATAGVGHGWPRRGGGALLWRKGGVERKSGAGGSSGLLWPAWKVREERESGGRGLVGHAER